MSASSSEGGAAGSGRGATGALAAGASHHTQLRGSLRVAKSADRADIEKLALANAGVQKHIAGQTVKKVVVVPGRLINVVV